MDVKSFFHFVSIVSSIVFTSFASADVSPLKKIAITQLAEHPSADAVREGILKALSDNGYQQGVDYRLLYENAQGNTVMATQIAQKLVAENPSVILPITTSSTQALVKADKAYSIPLVFAAVTDPIASGVVTSLTAPGGYITGVTDAAPVGRQIEVFKKILPPLKTLGILYNPGDDSSVSPVKETRAITQKMGITLIEATAFKTSDVTSAMQKLVGKKVDAVFVPLDNTVLSAMDAVLKIAFEYQIPVFSSDSDSVTQGALASSGYTHFDTGYKAGEMAVQVLKGINPGTIPVTTAQDLNVYINLRSAEKLHITFPEEILKIAREM